LLTNLFDASKKYKRIVLQYRLPHHVPVGVHEFNVRLRKQKSHLLLGCADRTAYIPRHRLTLGRGKKAIFLSDCSFIHAMVTLLYRILEQILRYDTVIRRTWVTAAGNNIAFKLAAKPLQINIWLLLTACRNLPSPYLTVPSPTSYDLPFSHNTCVTDRQTTYRTQGSTENSVNKIM